MNCFHLSVSLRYNTTSTIFPGEKLLLWIAFIYPYLWDTTQRIDNCSRISDSCELLSFIRIFEIQHNSSATLFKTSAVVNCFHLSVSLRYNTTPLADSILIFGLWIAFIYPYLWDTTQLKVSRSEKICRCELLSFIRIFEIQHNQNLSLPPSANVVNCFHLSVSLRYNTTTLGNYVLSTGLWIAFIYPYLWDTTQRTLSLDRI